MTNNPNQTQQNQDQPRKNREGRDQGSNKQREGRDESVTRDEDKISGNY